MVNIAPINYSQISTCDATTSNGTWAGSSAGTEGEFLKEGLGCLGFTIRTIGANVISFAPITALDLSGTKHLRLWFLSSTPNSLQTLANGGVQFYVTSGSETGYYYVSGKDDYPGGWHNLVVDLSRTADSGSKPPSMKGISSLGLNMICTTAPKNADNTWIDNFIYCDGLQCSGSTQFALSDIYALDNSTGSGLAWGVIRKISGVYYLTGNLTIGDNNGVGSTNFLDTSQLVVFEDRKVNNNLYGFTTVGNATGTTTFQLGNKSGVAGIQGCTIKSAGTAKYDITCTDTNVNTFKLYGCIFNDADTISLPTSGSNREMLNCSVEASNEISGSTCVAKYNKFIASDNQAVRISTGSSTLSTGSYYLTDSEFISCPKAVEIPIVGSYNFDALTFTNNTVDVDNTSGGAVTVICRYGSNPATETNDTTIVNQKTLTLDGLIAGSEVVILEAGTINVLIDEESSGTSFDYGYNYAANTYVDIIIFNVEYEYLAIYNFLLPNADSSIPISQRLDRNYYNP